MDIQPGHRRWRRFRALTTVLAAITVAGLATPTAVRGDTGPEETWVVEFADGVALSQRAAVLERPDVEIHDLMSWAPFALVSADAASRASLVDLAAVERVRRPMAVHAAAIPDDPHFDRQWNLRAVQAPAAWDVTDGTGAVVAVLDTGVDHTLPDLAGTRFAPGFDFIDGDGDATDENGHGSHVAGTIAQTTDNGIGVAGLAHGATVMPVRVLDADGAGNDYLVAQGINYAVSNGADVINLSLGGSGSTTVLYEAVQFAAGAGVTMVAAVGNDGAERINYPAAYDEVLAVGAVDQGDGLAPYSNWGAALDLVAPGGDLSEDLDGDGYNDGILQQTFQAATGRPACLCFYQGTSMATPHVAAAAALIIAAHDAGPRLVRDALLGSARDLGPTGPDATYGAGLLQAATALEVAADLHAPAPGPTPPPPPPTSDPVGEPVSDPDTSTFGEARDIDDACPAEEVPDAGFRDVGDGSAHAFAIDCVVWREVSRGTSAATYAPTATVTRAQMASFLARAVEDVGGSLPSDVPDAFTDDDESPHERSIDRLAAAGIVKGQLDRTYGPGSPVTRGQMATFLARTARHLTGDDLTSRVDYFDDDAENLHEDEINAVAHVGIATGVDLRQYAPARVVRRDQMASFLARMLDLVIESHGT